MKLVLLFNLLFLLSCCASIKNINKTKELSFEVSNYISNNISYITIPIDGTDVSIKLLNAAIVN